jgi:hypothetical protein
MDRRTDDMLVLIALSGATLIVSLMLLLQM